MNLVTIESQGVKFNIAAFDFENAEVAVADSNIALCTIRCECNRKSKWRVWNWKNLNLSLQMEFMWNFNGIRISFASNRIVGWMLTQEDVRVGENKRWRRGTGSRYEITYIPVCTHDSNKISTAIPMFSMSSNTTGLIWTLPFVGWVRNQTMAAGNRKWIGNNIYLSLYAK